MNRGAIHYDPSWTVSLPTPRRIVRVHELGVSGNLSRVSWKLSRTVLRGGTNGNVAFLLDSRTPKVKQLFCFEVNEGELFAFAGIWGRCKDAGGKMIETCAILTTTPNAVTSSRP